MLDAGLQQDLEDILRIDAIPNILQVVCQSTGMGFAAVARVTDAKWVCCSVLDTIGFGLQPGGELQLETTICNEIRQSGQAVVIDHVAQDATFCGHHTPTLYGFQSYISMPVKRRNGEFFGTLCAIDPRPARLDTPETLAMFRLFADLISFHLDAQEKLRASATALDNARETATLREQFMAVLGHDLRNPLNTLSMGLAVLRKAPERGGAMLGVMETSVQRMAELIENVADFARGRLGEGMALERRPAADLEHDLRQVVSEFQTGWPGREIVFEAALGEVPITCDRRRVAQLLSNLLANALKYGATGRPVRVVASAGEGDFVLSVVNGGPPIPAAVREGLFQPFFRTASHAGQDGLGLGLYIVAEIARAHGGTVDVESTPLQTAFSFRLPL